MTIHQLVAMAQRIHDAEGWDLGSKSSREQRNAFWAKVIGCAYWGHPVYNPTPDRQWHLKRADLSRPQTDDVATSLPSRAYWDCINGVGRDGYTFAVNPHAEPLPADQIVYAPPNPNDVEPEPEPPPVTFPSYEDIGGDAFYRAMIGVPLAADYVMAGQQLNDGAAVWFSRSTYSLIEALVRSNGQPIDAAGIVRRHRAEWRAALGLPPL